DNLWGFAGNYNVSVPKTIYDPCPPGFKVGHSGHAVFWQYMGSTPPQFSTSGSTLLTNTRGFVFHYEGKDFYYPATGHRNPRNGRLTDVGNQLWIWSSTRSDAAENNKWGGRAFRIYRNGATEYHVNPTERAER